MDTFDRCVVAVLILVGWVLALISITKCDELTKRVADIEKNHPVEVIEKNHPVEVIIRGFHL